LFEAVWGRQAFAIQWPADVEQVCNQPGPPAASDPTPVHLTAIDRGRAGATFDEMAQSIAGYEASAEVTAFTSKFDAVQAGKAQFTPQEQTGYDLFRGKAQCNACHRDGGPGEDPLFTDFTASNNWDAIKSDASLLCRAATRCTGLRRQPGRIIVCRSWCRRFSY
jgi:cytochrome c peroxidase